jgi:nucleoside phosphorylase
LPNAVTLIALTSGVQIAIIAALEREIRPLVKSWARVEVQHEGFTLVCFESNYAVAICGGIGPEAGRRAAQLAVSRYSPRLLISAGVAGGLTPELKVGETIFPALVVDAGDSSRHETAIKDSRIAATPLAKTVLVSYPEIAGAEQKHRLGKAYGAHAIDMEAASIARAAQANGTAFLAIKCISDEVDFELPAMMGFVREGTFNTRGFIAHVVVRPWLWIKVARLAQNTRLAAENLCAWLRESVLTNTIVSGSQG